MPQPRDMGNQHSPILAGCNGVKSFRVAARVIHWQRLFGDLMDALRLSLALSSGFGSGTAFAQPLPPSLVEQRPAIRRAAPPTPAFESLVRDFHLLLLESKPWYSTWAGIHRFDGTLESYEPGVRTARINRLRDLQKRGDRIDSKKLSMWDRHDLEVIRAGLAEQRFYLEELRNWERDPGLYLNAISSAITELVTKDQLPASVRLRRVLQCEQKIPALLSSARTNLNSTSRELTEIAIESLPDLVTSLNRDVPKAFESVTDKGLQAALAKQTRASVRVLKDFEAWMKSELLPRSTGTLAWGELLFRRKLMLSEQVDTPLDRLREIGLADLRRNQAALEQATQSFRPNTTIEEVLAEVGKTHPPAERLFTVMKERLEAARAFVVKRDLLTLPSSAMPVVSEMPSFLRSVNRARMVTVGPYTTSGVSKLYLTSPDPAWPTERVDSYLSYFNPGKLGTLAVHESFPGHFVMDCWLKRVPSMTRRLCMSGTSIEGWAHYVEQMMVEEGFAGDDPGHRIGQLQDALLRNVRFLVAIELHAKGMTLQNASAMFQREAYLPEVIAEMEARRAATEPEVINYTLGKLQLMKLREDLRRKQGTAFSLKGFHDAVLGAGILPVKLLREELLGEAGEDL